MFKFTYDKLKQLYDSLLGQIEMQSVTMGPNSHLYFASGLLWDVSDDN
jgi:hypothetical protein